MVIYFLLEERSMKEVLDVLLPKILPEEVAFKTIPHNGKSEYTDVNNNSSESFRQFVSGVRRLCSIEDEEQRASNLSR